MALSNAERQTRYQARAREALKVLARIEAWAATRKLPLAEALDQMLADVRAAPSVSKRIEIIASPEKSSSVMASLPLGNIKRATQKKG